jgi:tryptophan synthase alpha chain
VTGRGRSFAANLTEQILAIREHTELPVAAGFGIRSAEDVAALPSELDGVVIGARLLEIVMAAPGTARARRDVSEFLESLKPALRRTP